VTVSGERAGAAAWPGRGVWLTVALLAAIGVLAASLRVAFPGDLSIRAEPVRERLMAALSVNDPLLSERPAQLARFEERYASHRLATLLHVVPGGLFLLFAPLQLSSRIRNRHIRLHRWSGRVLIGLAFVAAGSALYFAMLMPFGGAVEMAMIPVIAALFLGSIARAYLAIRAKDVVRHREWMVRALAVALSISVIRLIAPVTEVLLVPRGVHPPELLMVSMIAGWVLMVVATELWIRGTRRTASAMAGMPAADVAG
jgi:uncharacterized membrane protein